MDRNMIVEIERLVLQSQTHQIDGKTYSAAPLRMIFEKIEILEVETLTGFIDYINSGIDKEFIKEPEVFISVDSVNTVLLYTKIDAGTKKRQTIIRAKLFDKSIYPTFPTGMFLVVEDFIIKLESFFVDSPQKSALISFVSRLIVNNSIQVGDDGITQTVEVKKGMSGALKDTETAPKIIDLRPYRTFGEIEQPLTKYLFRMRADDRVPTCALFTTDSEMWRNQAMLSIKDYLKKALPNLTIIA